MRILLLGPNQNDKYNWGHQLFLNELKNYLDIMFYGLGYKHFDATLKVQDIINKYGPFDFMLTNGLRYTEPFEGLGDAKIKKAHIIVDYFPEHSGGYKGTINRQNNFFIKSRFDVLFVRQFRQIKELESNNIKVPSYYLPFSVDTNIYKFKNLPKKYDVMTTATKRDDVYPNRNKVDKIILENKIKLFNKRIVHQEYINTINSSKIFLISNNVFGTLTMKYTEAMSCGAFVLADRPVDIDRLGLKDGEHLVLYNGTNDMIEKVKYYLNNEDERNRISEQGMKFVIENHNNTIRAKYLLDIIKKEFTL